MNYWIMFFTFNDYQTSNEKNNSIKKVYDTLKNSGECENEDGSYIWH